MVERIDAGDFVDTLAEAGLDLWAGVPDSLLADLCAAASEELGRRFVITANEGNAVGMAVGWHVATGRSAVVYMQNSGQGNAVNPLLSLADPDVYGIPMLLVVGWRGEPGVHDEPQHVKQGEVTLGLFEAMGVPYEVLEAGCWQAQLDRMVATMRSQGRPVALVVRKATFAAHPFRPEVRADPLTREEALEGLLAQVGEDDLVVATTGKCGREVFEIRERRGQPHDRDFLTVGGMGHTLSVAFGMALGTRREVWCLDGDGSMLMHMGGLAVMCQRWPDNLHYVVNDNGAHESVGGQPTVGRAVDVVGILRSCGFAGVVEARTAEEVADGVAALSRSPRTALVLYTRQGSRADLGRPTVSPSDNKRAMMGRLGVGGADGADGTVGVGGVAGADGSGGADGLAGADGSGEGEATA